MNNILQEINKIRDIKDKVKTSSNLELNLLDNVLIAKEDLSDIDRDLLSIYANSILDLAGLLIEMYGEDEESENLLKFVLAVDTDQAIRARSYELLLKIVEIKENPFNNYKKIQGIIIQLEEAYKRYYHPESFKDMVNYSSNPLGINILSYQQNIDKIFSSNVIKSLSEIKSDNLKSYVIEQLLKHVNSRRGLYGGLTSNYVKTFFKRVKVLAQDNEYLLSKVNERIYGVNFDTRGFINKFDKLKNRMFKK